jgi:hypothetical protein
MLNVSFPSLYLLLGTTKKSDRLKLGAEDGGDLA